MKKKYQINNLFVFLAILVAYKVYKQRRKKPKSRGRRKQAFPNAFANKKKQAVSEPRLDTRRKALIAYGQPWDHSSDCQIVQAHVDLNQTIFKTVKTWYTRYYIQHTMSLQPAWVESASQEINAAFSDVPVPPPHKIELLEFMNEECDFEIEHADGSFLDHLQFCYEYSCAHYGEQSPRVLFLHSIMGVGTNLFPMTVAKIPKLKSLLSESEFKHIEAFPSILRLLSYGQFMKDVESLAKDAKKLKEIQFHRVIDNKLISLTGDELWVQLNYQLIHSMDFIPFANWEEFKGIAPFSEFIALYTLLKDANLLFARVDLDLKCCQSADLGPVTIGSLVQKVICNLPEQARKKIRSDMNLKYSNAIGHSLEYSFVMNA